MKRSIFLFYILVLNFGLFVNANKKCHILSLSGGGSHGAYQAGIIANISNKYENFEDGWDVLLGVSAGSLNALGISHYNKPLNETIEYVKRVWCDMKISDVYNYHLSLKSIFDTTPFRKLLENNIKDSNILMKPTIISATSLKLGKRVLFDNDVGTEVDLDQFMASSAMPILFPAIEYNNDLYIDGGISGNILVLEGLHYCKSKFVEIDIVITSKLSKLEFTENSIFYIIPRLLSILKNLLFYSEIENIKESYKCKYDNYLQKVKVNLYSLSKKIEYSNINVNYGSIQFEEGLNMKNVILEIFELCIY